MRTVRDACKFHENALNVKLSDQIEQLDELIKAEGTGEAYFMKTYITQEMADVVSEGFARLAGQTTQTIFHLKQAMGGGKNHLLVGFGLLAKSLSLRQAFCPNMANIDKFQDAQVAAFNGRNNPEHYFWGEIAQQLGKGAEFTNYWTSGPQALDENAWINLFTGEKPILILMGIWSGVFWTVAGV